MARTRKVAGETTGSGKSTGETYSADERICMIEKAKGRKLKACEKEAIRPKNTEWQNTNLFSQIPEGDISDLDLILDVNEKIVLLPSVDLDDYEAVKQRLNEYITLFKAARQRPTVQAMGMALNHDRKWLHAVVTNSPISSQGNKAKLKPEVAELIKRYYQLQEAMWESWTLSGKLNPVSSIFLGKNNYGYKDRVETVMVNDSDSLANYTTEDIATRYDSLPTSDS